MKLDQLEQFVLDHRDEFDDLEPGKEFFQELNTPEKKIIPFKNWKTMARVAAAVIIFSLGFALNEFVSTDSNQTNKLIADDNELNMENDSMRMAFEEMQFYYTSQINTVKDEIILLSNSDEVISNELDYQMEEFNTIFEELKNDLMDQANDEEVIEAMILNYRVKLRLLEDMKEQLDSSKQEGEEVQYETIDI